MRVAALLAAVAASLLNGACATEGASSIPVQANEPDPDCTPGALCVMDASGVPKLPAETNRGVCVLTNLAINETACWDVCQQSNDADNYKVSSTDASLNQAMSDAVTQARARVNPGVNCPVPPEPVAAPCTPGRGCRYNGEAGRGTCVVTTEGTECWDTCDEDISVGDYCRVGEDENCEDRVNDMRNNRIDPGCGAGGWWWGWVIGILVLCCLCGILGGLYGYTRAVKPRNAPDFQDEFITEEVYEVTEEPDEPMEGSRAAPMFGSMMAAPMATAAVPAAYYQTRAPVSNSVVLPGTYSMGPQQPAYYSRGAAPSYVSGSAQPYSTRIY